MSTFKKNSQIRLAPGEVLKKQGQNEVWSGERLPPLSLETKRAIRQMHGLGDDLETNIAREAGLLAETRSSLAAETSHDAEEPKGPLVVSWYTRPDLLPESQLDAFKDEVRALYLQTGKREYPFDASMEESVRKQFEQMAHEVQDEVDRERAQRGMAVISLARVIGRLRQVVASSRERLFRK